MAVSSVGLRLKWDCSGKAQKQLYSKLHTRFLVREDALIIVKRKKKSKIKSGQGSQREARYPDVLVNWLSAARRTPTPNRLIVCLVLLQLSRK
jgi:hypothetical protein